MNLLLLNKKSMFYIEKIYDFFFGREEIYELN